MYQLEFLIPPTCLLHQPLESEFAGVNLLDQWAQLAGAGGREAQPARQAVGSLGGAAGASAVILIGRQGGRQCFLSTQIAHFYLLDGLVFLPLGYGRKGIDVSLQQG